MRGCYADLPRDHKAPLREVCFARAVLPAEEGERDESMPLSDHILPSDFRDRMYRYLRSQGASHELADGTSGLAYLAARKNLTGALDALGEDLLTAIEERGDTVPRSAGEAT